MSIHGFWIPIEDGERQCCNCGTHWGGITLECGDHYCGICEGRGRDEDHDEPGECKHGAKSPAFKRLEHDCPACGLRHLDWDTCADLVHEFARRDGARPGFGRNYTVRNGVAVAEEVLR